MSSDEILFFSHLVNCWRKTSGLKGSSERNPSMQVWELIIKFSVLNEKSICKSTETDVGVSWEFTRNLLNGKKMYFGGIKIMLLLIVFNNSLET